MKTPETEQEVFTALAAECARREHSSGEMLQKMKKWGFGDEQTRARVIARLVREKYVDDERFARFFISDKIKFNKWGRKKIEQALWAKGVSEDISRPQLDNIDKETYLEVLRPLIKSKRKSIKGGDDYEIRNKLIRFALGRGFELDLIMRCLE